MDNSIVKIGCSIDISNRMRNFNTSTDPRCCVWKPTCIVHGPAYLSEVGVRELENILHEKFAQHRINPNREFFHDSIHSEFNSIIEDLRSCGYNLMVDGDIVPQPYIPRQVIYKSTHDKTHIVLQHEQRVAFTNAIDIFKTQKNQNGYLFQPCGWGKTVFSVHLLRELNYEKVLVITPTKDICEQWMNWLGCDGYNIVDSDYNHAQFTMRTITTYQSAIARLDEIASMNYQFVIFDEAHHLSGMKTSVLKQSTSLFNQRMFITATPRITSVSINDDDDDDDSSEIDIQVDSELKYNENEVISRSSLDDSINLGILCNYQIKVVEEPFDGDGITLNSLFDQLSNTHMRRRIVVFFNTRANAQYAMNEFEKYLILCNKKDKYKLLYVDGETQNGERLDIFCDMNKIPNYHCDEQTLILFNIDVVGEGVNIPPIDGIVFAESRLSSIKIMQNIGRGLRLSPNKNNCIVVINSTMDGMIESIINTLYHINNDKSVCSKITSTTKIGFQHTIKISNKICVLKSYLTRIEKMNIIMEKYKDKTPPRNSSENLDERSDAYFISNVRGIYNSGVGNKYKKFAPMTNEERVSWETNPFITFVEKTRIEKMDIITAKYKDKTPPRYSSKNIDERNDAKFISTIRCIYNAGVGNKYRTHVPMTNEERESWKNNPLINK